MNPAPSSPRCHEARQLSRYRAEELLVAFGVLEDGTLQAELPGYRQDAARVRFRCLPGV
jgi:hypothetical protein